MLDVGSSRKLIFLRRTSSDQEDQDHCSQVFSDLQSTTPLKDTASAACLRFAAVAGIGDAKCLAMGISTNATQSMPSPVMNLCEVNSHINMEQLFSAVGWEFLRTCPQSMQDGGHDLISQQYGFQLVNPTEGWFPGLEKSREELASWDWRFGKTPKFTVTRSFRVPEELTEDSMADEELRIKLDINNGIIEDITLQIPPGFMSASGFHGDASVITNLRGELAHRMQTGEWEESLSHYQRERSSASYCSEWEGNLPSYCREREGNLPSYQTVAWLGRAWDRTVTKRVVGDQQFLALRGWWQVWKVTPLYNQARA
uniref:(California timema) hypothetical protein n=1 Tax=Timema californicum TaxID=61474 RepID=A0A7R9JDZ2_TIMCA|nr:unnamed protein product [Timema californicum]